MSGEARVVHQQGDLHRVVQLELTQQSRDVCLYSRSTAGRSVDVGFESMRQVSDGFLLNMAEVSSQLLGLFLVGVLFFAEAGFRRLDRTRKVVEPYFRASTRIVLVLFAIPLGLSLTLVALEPIWTTVLFAVLSLTLLAANVDTAARIRAVAKVTGSKALLVNEVLGTAGVLAIVTIPWILGGLRPTRQDLAWSILLSFGVGFISVCAMVLSVFDIGRYEAAARTSGDGL